MVGSEMNDTFLTVVSRRTVRMAERRGEFEELLALVRMVELLRKGERTGIVGAVYMTCI